MINMTKQDLRSSAFHRRAPVLIALSAAALALSACTVGRTYSQPKITVPTNFEQAPASNGRLGTATFKAFAAPALDALIAQALLENTTIAQALARLDEARAYRGLTKYSLFPTVTAAGEKTRSKISGQDPQAPPGLGITDSVDVGFDASWEIDLFGSLRNQSAAVVLRAEAASAALEDVKRVIVAEVAQTFFAALGARERLAITTRNQANLTENERIVQALVDAGRGTDLDLARAKSLTLSVAAGVPLQQAELTRQTLRMASLTGLSSARVRDYMAQQRAMPELAVLQNVGSVDAWLKRRPDVRAAELTLRAQLKDVGAQTAEYFPKLTLLGSFGSVARKSSDVFGSDTDRWRFGPSISWRFLDFGRVGQYVKAEQAQANGAAAAYQETVLRALEDVEAALANFRAANESTAAFALAAIEAEKARALAELRFEAGASDFLVVLDAQRQRLSLDDQLVQAQTARATALAMLYKALAGDFMRLTP
jgi:outer membrane protein, multidrug efflux system